VRTTISGRPLALVAVAVLTLGGFALPAVADPSDAPSQEQVDAARAAAEAKAGTVEGVQARLNAANARLSNAELVASQAAESANGAIWRLQQAESAAKQANAEERGTRRTLRNHQAAYTDLIARTYEQQPELQALNALATKALPQQMVESASTTSQLATAMDDIETGYRDAARAAAAASKKADEARREAAALAEQATAARNQAAAAADSAAAEADAVAQEKTALIAEIARLQHISVSLASQRQSALEEEQRRAAAAAAAVKAENDAREAAAAAAAQAAADKAAQDARDNAAQNPSPQAPKPEPKPTVDPTPPAPSGGASAAIAFAKAQLGEPYLWAAAGPDRWDCSGLTMGAWAAGGKSLPHYSVAQYDQSTPIPISSAQPGDLLFWSSNGSPSGIHHVALYLGGGQYIHAPRAGKNVEIKSLSYWYPTMAARP
jgi:cell wall-associated NlpC family hydrolase